MFHWAVLAIERQQERLKKRYSWHSKSGSVEKTLMKEEANEEENERELSKECKNYYSANHITYD